MNIADKNNTDLLFLNFNQDFSCISVGTKRGYRIYNCDPFGKCYSKGQWFISYFMYFLILILVFSLLLLLWIADGGTGIVEMLFCTSLVALVGAGEQPTFSTRHLQIINTKVSSLVIYLFIFPTTVTLLTSVFLFFLLIETIDYLWTHVPYFYPGCQDEPSSTYCGAGRTNLCLRYQQYETFTYYWY